MIFGIYTNEDDGTFVQVKLKLPDDAKAGDFYEVKLLESYDSVNPCLGLVNPESKIIYGSEYFGGFSDGGIQITDEQPPQQDHNDQDSQANPVVPSNQSGQDQNNEEQGEVNGNSNNVQTQAKSVTSPVTTVSQTTAAFISTATTVKVTSVSTVAGTEYAETNISTQTDMKEEATSASEKNDNNGKSNTKVIICIAAMIAILASVLAVALKGRKKKDNIKK